MKLLGLNGVSFVLEIDAYEFPQLTEHDEDSNWLMVRGQVDYPGGGWFFHEPCLTTSDLRELAGWFDSVSQGTPSVAMCWFDEPNLAFEYRSISEAAVVVHFTHECAPAWQDSDERLGHCEVSFDLALNDCAAAARDLRAFLMVFPERGNRTDPGAMAIH